MTRRIARFLPWLVLLVVVTTGELLVRFTISFNLRRVLLVEAALFLAAGLVGAILSRRSAPKDWYYVLQWILVGGFLLASVRATAWGLGMQVARANMLIALLGTVALATVWWRRRAKRRAFSVSGGAAA